MSHNVKRIIVMQSSAIDVFKTWKKIQVFDVTFVATFDVDKTRYVSNIFQSVKILFF